MVRTGLRYGVIVTVHPTDHHVSDEGRAGSVIEGGLHQVTEEMEGILALEPAGPGDGEKALSKALAVFRLTAEAYLPPLNGMTQCSLSSIVGGLDAFMENEGKEVLPLFEHLAGASTHGSILAGLVLLTVSLHPAPNEGGRLPELLAGDSLIDKGIPTDEKTVDFIEHVCGKPLRVRTATNFQ